MLTGAQNVSAASLDDHHHYHPLIGSSTVPALSCRSQYAQCTPGASSCHPHVDPSHSSASPASFPSPGHAPDADLSHGQIAFYPDSSLCQCPSPHSYYLVFHASCHAPFHSSNSRIGAALVVVAAAMAPDNL